MKFIKIFIIICISYISICNSKLLDEDNIIDDGLAQNVTSSLLPNSQDAEIEDHTSNVSKVINAEEDSIDAFNDKEDDPINNYNEDKKTERIPRLFKKKIVFINEINVTSVKELPISFLERLGEERKRKAEREEVLIKEAEVFNRMRNTQVDFNALRERMEESNARMEEANAVNRRFEDFYKEFRPITFTPPTIFFNTRKEYSNWWEDRNLMKLIFISGSIIILLIIYSLIYLSLKCRNKIPSAPKYFKDKGTDEAKLPLPGAMEKEFDC